MLSSSLLSFFNDPPTSEIYTLSLHDALPIYFMPATCHPIMAVTGAQCIAAGLLLPGGVASNLMAPPPGRSRPRSEEHTSELQSRPHLVCRLLLEKKKKTKYKDI